MPGPPATKLSTTGGALTGDEAGGSWAAGDGGADDGSDDTTDGEGVGEGEGGGDGAATGKEDCGVSSGCGEAATEIL